MNVRIQYMNIPGEQEAESKVEDLEEAVRRGNTRLQQKEAAAEVRGICHWKPILISSEQF